MGVENKEGLEGSGFLNVPRFAKWLFQEELLPERLYVQSIVRFVGVMGVVGGALFARYVVGLQALHILGVIVPAAVLAVFNSGAFWVGRQFRGSTVIPRRLWLLQNVMHATITVDLLFITVALWFVGGAKSPFQSFYLIYLMLVSMLLSRRAAFSHALSAYLQFSGVVLAQWFGLISTRFPAGAVNSAAPLDGKFVLTVLVVQALVMGLGVYFATGLSIMLRRSNACLERANEELARLSVMGQPFSSVALHDLKTPLNATAMLLRNISDGLCGPLTEKQSEWLSKCQRRLSELSSMLHNFEILAMLDSEAVEKQRQSIEIGPFLENIAEEYRDTAESHGHSFTLDINQNAAVVMGIDRLLHEAVANLLAQAITYTPAGAAIMLRLKKQEDMVMIEIEDTAIGMAEEDRSRLFGESVRFSAEAASNHNVPGTTLGLSIVKRIVDIHDGKVELNSTPGRGGVFRIILPRSNQP